MNWSYLPCGSFSGELSSQTVPLQQWTHIAVVVGYLNTAVTYYVNGNYAHTWDPGGATMIDACGGDFTAATLTATASWSRTS